MPAQQQLPTLPQLYRPDPDPSRFLAELRNDRLTILNQQFPFHGGADWQMVGKLKEHLLWIENVHYHAWFVNLARGYGRDGDEAYAKTLHHYLNDWIGVCRLGAPGFTRLAWNSFSIGTRLVNWWRMFQSLPDAFWRNRPGFGTVVWQSFIQQAAYLEDHIEWDLRANHLLRDALGLACAGRCWHGPRADQWLSMAKALVLEQVPEQVLADGGHFERSPMYHLHVMEDLCYLQVLLQDTAVTRALAAVWPRMLEQVRWLRHPDGGVPLFNDGGFNGSPPPAAILSAAPQLGVDDVSLPKAGRWFPDTGLVVWHGTPWSLFFDVGLVGPDYQPGHAHADTLSLECSYVGQRLIVDPGTFAYDNDAVRQYDRGTAAHNTVCIDAVDSTEVWHIHRTGRRARPLDVSCDIDPHGLRASASHTGYDHLPGRPRHVRRVTVTNDGPLQIVDRIEGGETHEVQAGYLLAPPWSARTLEDGWELTHGAMRVRVRLCSEAGVTHKVDSACYHPEYGLELQTSRLTWEYRGRLPLEVQVEFAGSSV